LAQKLVLVLGVVAALCREVGRSKFRADWAQHWYGVNNLKLAKTVIAKTWRNEPAALDHGSGLFCEAQKVFSAKNFFAHWLHKTALLFHDV
jgi:hypothetical protein